MNRKGKWLPLGSVVGITYDSEDNIDLGDALVTRTGRTYVVLNARQQQKGMHRGRWHLKCTVAKTDDRISGKIHPLIWHSRSQEANDLEILKRNLPTEEDIARAVRISKCALLPDRSGMLKV